MKRGKRIMMLIFGIILIIAILLIISGINHRIQSARERELLQPLGEMVEVDGNQMCVYTQGDGEKTLVFMSGGGTCSPILDFRSLYSLLSDDYKIAVVEKFGYGFSDIADVDRDIDTVLENTRTALKQANVTGPFVLCPHSMSGIEALYWAQQYPDEVSAIIGLDMSVPEAYKDYHINMPLVCLGQYAAGLGITRLIPGIAESDAIKYGTLTDEEKEIYRAVFFARTATATMVREVRCIKDSARKVEDGETPQIPMLFFVSNGTGTGWDEEKWMSYQQNYINKVTGGKMIKLECPHYVHDYEYEAISADIKVFLSGMQFGNADGEAKYEDKTIYRR